jgi:hypothetical protein
MDWCDLTSARAWDTDTSMEGRATWRDNEHVFVAPLVVINCQVRLSSSGWHSAQAKIKMLKTS